IVNGMALHGGIIPYAATFLAFSDYMRPAIRLAALTELRVIFIFTHDSIGLGEDGPTHQPVEQLLSLRAIPGLVTLRPADATETAEAWRVALQRHGPTALILSRQALPVLDRAKLASASGVARGAYVLADGAWPPDVILIASGSEVHIALEAQRILGERGIGARVVSMPSWELFDGQPEAYRAEVLPPSVSARVAIEAGRSLGWSAYVGDRGTIIALDRFGASAPAAKLFEAFGFTPEQVAARAATALGR
ncbi:MAG: transketolase, partial [Candidatus Rokubacteria bacterium]|nr:transketolase [Candidatus Rokubacteria bacterium]